MRSWHKVSFTIALSVAAAFPRLASSATVSSEDYAVQYDYDEFRAAVDGKSFQVILAGTPFADLPMADLSRRLLPVLQANKPRPSLVFSYASTATQGRPDYRLILVFNTANDLTARQVCNGEARFKPGRGGRLDVFAVYCRDATAMSQAIARATASTPEDVETARLFAQLFAVVFSDAQFIRPSNGYPGGLR